MASGTSSAKTKNQAATKNIVAEVTFREIAPADNQLFFDTVLKKSPLYGDFMFSNCNIAPFIETWNDPLIPAMMALGNAGRAKTLGIMRLDFDTIYTCVCAEMLGPVLPDALFLAQPEAEATIVASVKALFSAADREQFTGLKEEHFTEARKKDATFPPFEAGSINTAAIAIKILHLMAEHSATSYQIGALGILLHTCVSIIKRGTVSTQYTDKIQMGVADDLGACPALKPNVLSMFYSRFGLYLNDTKIKEIFTRWQLQIGDKALRLTLSIQQAAGSGITSYLAIVEALQKFDDFPWTNIYAKFPIEWVAFNKAIDAVGDNKYYGYRKELGPAKSTNFKSLAYVAKELLIRIGGNTSLKAYGGWTSRIASKTEIDAMIVDYEEKRRLDLTGDALTEAKTKVKETIDKIKGLSIS